MRPPPGNGSWDIRQDDLTQAASRDLVRLHLEDMHANRRSFVAGPAFADYEASGFNQFLHLSV